MDTFAKFFSLAPSVLKKREPVEDIAKETMEDATDWLTFSRHPGYSKLMEWLEREADRPVAPRADVVDMVAGIARQNTLKEIRDYLRKMVSTSQATVDRYREASNAES